MSASPYGYPNADFHLSHLHRHPTAYMPHAMHMNQVMPQHIHHPYQIEMYAPTMPMSGPIDHNMAVQPPPHLMYSSQPLGVPVSTQPNFSLPLGSGGLGIGSVGLVAEPHPPIPEEASANPPPPHNRRSFFQSLRGSVSSGSNENLPPIETYLPSELVCDSEDEITSVSVENDLIPGLHGSFGSPMISFNDSRALWDSSSPSSSPVPAHRQELSGRSLSPLRPHPKAATSTTPLAEPWEVDLSFSQGSSHQASSSSDSQQSPLSSPRSSKDVGSGSTTKKSTSSDDLSRQNKTSATSSTPSTVPKLTISPADSSETTVLDPSPRRREKLTSPRRRSPRSPRYDAPETRFTSIEQCVGQITSLCKDQRGCRFLQKKLDEKDPNAPTLIFNEVFDKIVELMTDPFGNYLCQKLLEHCNEQQCLAIIELVSKHIVQISKNLHGTRAIQKMIEFLSSEAQIALVVRALAPNVVTLIKDLNGNHVIQRCLHRLSSTDNQFLFDAVAKSCVEVATHRHGCCVFQRCLDHASESQRLILIQQIARHGYVLVRDPYGNYVVQYVLDLKGFDDIKIMLTNAFKTHMVELSSQKFSSNVIEKCLSACPREVKYWMVEELMESNALNSLLRDPFGNYVIQTALTVSGDEQHYRLVEAIRPHLPSLRNTSYGKRIQNKILRDGSSKA